MQKGKVVVPRRAGRHLQSLLQHVVRTACTRANPRIIEMARALGRTARQRGHEAGQFRLLRSRAPSPRRHGVEGSAAALIERFGTSSTQTGSLSPWRANSDSTNSCRLRTETTGRTGTPSFAIPSNRLTRCMTDRPRKRQLCKSERFSGSFARLFSRRIRVGAVSLAIRCQNCSLPATFSRGATFPDNRVDPSNGASARLLTSIKRLIKA